MNPQKADEGEIGHECLTPEEATKPGLGPQSPTVPQANQSVPECFWEEGNVRDSAHSF